jgi:dUTP pyrophosphatase
MAKFYKVSRFADVDLPMPTRATSSSAGYDFVVAEDIVIPPYDFLNSKIRDNLFDKKRHEDYFGFIDPLTLDEMAQVTKETSSKITLVSTGMKCQLAPNQYLELSMRSSTPLKHWLMLGNSVGIIDADYFENPSNDGEIFF